MTLPAQKVRTLFDGDGVTTVIPVAHDGQAIYFRDNTHIHIEKRGVDKAVTTLVEGTDYTLSGSPDSGNVLLATPLLTGERLVVWREQPIDQDTDISVNEDYDSEVAERTWDKSREIDQELADEIARAIKLSRFTDLSNASGEMSLAEEGQIIRATADGVADWWIPDYSGILYINDEGVVNPMMPTAFSGPGMIAPMTGDDKVATVFIDGEFYVVTVDTKSEKDVIATIPYTRNLPSGYRYATEDELNAAIAALNGNVISRFVVQDATNASFSAALASEASTRSSADSSLTSSLNAEVLTRAGADSTLQAALNAESATRSAAVSSLSTRVGSLEASQAAQDSLIATLASQAALTQEIADRVAGDAATLASANAYTDAEISALLGGVPQSTLDTIKEIDDAITAGQVNATTLAANIATNAADIASEITARTNADTALDARLDTLEAMFNTNTIHGII